MIPPLKSKTKIHHCCMYVNIFCSVCKINFFSEVYLVFIIANTANSTNISFYFAMGHKIIIYFTIYNKARQKGATRFLLGATWFLPADCPMGNLIFLGVVKACHIFQGYFTSTATSICLLYWEIYWWINHSNQFRTDSITTTTYTKHKTNKTNVCIFYGIYCAMGGHHRPHRYSYVK